MVYTFCIMGLPLTYYRSRFRKIVYQTDSWTINIKPVFRREIRALFGNIYPDNLKYKKFRNFYLFYLLIYVLLFIAYLIFDAKTEKMKKIEVGSQVPLFELKDQNGELFKIGEVLGKKSGDLFLP